MRYVFGLIMLLGLLVPDQARSSFEVCRALLDNKRIVDIENQYGGEGVEFHYHILQHFSEQSAKTRRRIFDYFMVVGSESQQVFFDLQARRPENIKELVGKLANLKAERREELLKDHERWLEWADGLPREPEFVKEIAPKDDNWGYEEVILLTNPKEGTGPKNLDLKKRSQDRPPTKRHVWVNGKRIDRKFHERAQKLARKLEKRGIHTEFVPGRTYRKKKGRGFLVIQKIEGETSSEVHPANSVYKTAEFQRYLELVKEEAGAVVIDPDLFFSLSAGAYFSNRKNALKGKDWIIALKPDTNWSTFVHEWQHKMDLVDNRAQYNAQQVTRGVPKNRSSKWGQAIDRAGRMLEQQYLTELNATGKEMDLFFETRKFPFFEVIGVQIYRGQNERRVAIGRIFVDPLHPGHYALYLKSRARVYVPATLGAGVSVGLTALILQIINTLSDD